MQIDLSDNEAAVLTTVLDSALGELREEVYKSELADYKASLKEREMVLTALLQRLSTRVSGG